MMVIALPNQVGVPVDTLGVPREWGSADLAWGQHDELVGVDWYMDEPGRPTLRVMRPSEFREIPEG